MNHEIKQLVLISISITSVREKEKIPIFLCTNKKLAFIFDIRFSWKRCHKFFAYDVFFQIYYVIQFSMKS